MNFAALSPLQTAIAIVVGVAVVGVLIAYIISRRRFSGFANVAPAAREIAKRLNTDVTRDGPDLVISGTYQGLPTFVRFSSEIETPGMTVHMRAPVSFILSVQPEGAIVDDTLMPNQIRSGDSFFDQRFIIRTDQATQARLMLTRNVISVLQKLCYSTQTSLEAATGEMEFTENVIPEGDVTNRLATIIQNMRALAEAFNAMPGSEGIKLPVYKTERHVVGRLAIGVFAIAAIIFVIGAVRTPTPELPKNETYVPAGMTPNQASLVDRLDGWKVATADDLPRDVLHHSGEPGKLVGDFSGRGTQDDVVYLLTDPRHQFRMLIISNHSLRYDAIYPSVAAIARVARDNVSNITWNGSAPQGVTTDGILLVPQADQYGSATVLFYEGNVMTTGTPADYRNVPIE